MSLMLEITLANEPKLLTFPYDDVENFGNIEQYSPILFFF